MKGLENPAYCASRGLYPTELLNHTLWWHSPIWLKKPPADWREQLPLPPSNAFDEERLMSLHVAASQTSPILPVDKYSNFLRLKLVTAWVLRFLKNCSNQHPENWLRSHLSTAELQKAEHYLLQFIQRPHFNEEIQALKRQNPLSSSSPLSPLNPFLDSSGLCESVVEDNSSNLLTNRNILSYCMGNIPQLVSFTQSTSDCYMLVQVSSLHPCVAIITWWEEENSSALSPISITCRKNSAKPQPQMLGQLPIERVTHDPIFNKVGVDYAGPLMIKCGRVRKPKRMCVFLSPSS